MNRYFIALILFTPTVAAAQYGGLYGAPAAQARPMYVTAPPPPPPNPYAQQNQSNGFNPTAYRQNFESSLPRQQACVFTGQVMRCN